jgi:hypothetical protein
MVIEMHVKTEEEIASCPEGRAIMSKVTIKREDGLFQKSKRYR